MAAGKGVEDKGRRGMCGGKYEFLIPNCWFGGWVGPSHSSCGPGEKRYGIGATCQHPVKPRRTPTMGCCKQCIEIFS